MTAKILDTVTFLACLGVLVANEALGWSLPQWLLLGLATGAGVALPQPSKGLKAK